MKVPINDLSTTTILRFWKHMMARYPDEWRDGKPKPEGMRWHELDEIDLVVSLTTGIDFIRVFVRGPRSAKAANVRKKLVMKEENLVADLGCPLSGSERDRFFSSRLDLDMTNEANWDRAADWLWERSQTYEAILRAAFPRSRAGEA